MEPTSANKMQFRYRNYWQRKFLVNREKPPFPITKYWDNEIMSPAELLIFNKVKNCGSLLDFGAGDFRVKNKMLKAGFTGRYFTLDIGHEYQYDFNDLSECQQKFDGILLIDVLEHLDLESGLQLLLKLQQQLSSQGVLIIQTPNAKCLRSPLGTDMTHMQIYNLNDLWAYLSAEGFTCSGYRVVFEIPGTHFLRRCFNWFSHAIISRVLGCDYAENILLIAQKSMTSA
mgnify:CR=1 FL=1